MVDHEKTWLTVKNPGDHGRPWSSFRLGSVRSDYIRAKSFELHKRTFRHLRFESDTYTSNTRSMSVVIR